MNKIREVANKKGIKIADIIKTTGLAKSFVYDVINEGSYPTIPNAQKIAGALNSSLDELFPSN